MLHTLRESLDLVFFSWESKIHEGGVIDDSFQLNHFDPFGNVGRAFLTTRTVLNCVSLSVEFLSSFVQSFTTLVYYVLGSADLGLTRGVRHILDEFIRIVLGGRRIWI